MTAPVLNPQTCAVIQSVNESVGIGDIPLLTEGWTGHQEDDACHLIWSGRGGRSQTMLRECIPKLAL